MNLSSLFKSVISAASLAPAGQVAIEPLLPAENSLREAFGTTIDADDAQYRALTDGSGELRRNLTPLQQDRMQKIAAWLWEANPLANRTIELPTAYLVGEGVRLAVEDEEAQKVLARFWRDPITAMDLKLEAMVREGELYGEQCYPVFVNEQTGHVRLGYLDPGKIGTVVMDPDNPSQPVGVVTKKDANGATRSYKVIVGGDDAELFTARTQQIRAGFTAGECFFKRANYLLGGVRGRSAILPEMDWLDQYDNFLYGELDRAEDLRAHIWDVELTGASPEDVAKRAGEITPPEPRSVRVHNELEKWQALAPSLQAGDTAEASRLFRNHVLGGVTIPEHWFATGGDVNRATAGEMGEPTFKVLTSKQKQWKYFLELIGRYVLAQAAAKGQLKGYDPEADEFQVEAVFPELTARDTTKYASAMQAVTAACILNMDAGLMTKQTAVRVIAAVAGRLGVEYDAEIELDAAQKEAEETKAKRAKEEADDYGNPKFDDDDDRADANARAAASPPPAPPGD